MSRTPVTVLATAAVAGLGLGAPARQDAEVLELDRLPARVIDLSRRTDLPTREPLDPQGAQPGPVAPRRVVPTLPDEPTVAVLRDEQAQLRVEITEADGTPRRRVLHRGFLGDGHLFLRLPDRRLLVLLRDSDSEGLTEGDLTLCIGTLDALLASGPPTYRVRLHESSGIERIWPSGLQRLQDGSLACMARCQDPDGRSATALTVLVHPDDLDRLANQSPLHDLPVLDLDGEADRQVVVDREPGQYLGHPTTVLLEDGRTLLCIYPKGHGKGALVYRRSSDGGKTWSERLPVPPSWATSKEVPTLHRVIDAEGRRRLILFSGLHPARMAVSEDDGSSFGELEPVGEWGGIVVMGDVKPIAAPGSYLAWFHDDGRFFAAESRKLDPVVFTLYQTRSTEGGLRWSPPRAILSSSRHHLCEPGVVRSRDGRELAMLLRENSRRHNSQILFSRDEGATWSLPRDLPGSLNGDRHTARHAPDGRLLISFRKRSPAGHTAPAEGDWVAWVGTYEDLVHGREGQYVVRLKDNKHQWDTAYPGVEVLPDGTFVLTTYGHWDQGESPYILSVRLKLEELDERAR